LGRRDPYAAVGVVVDGYGGVAQRFTVPIVRRRRVILCKPPAVGQTLAGGSQEWFGRNPSIGNYYWIGGNSGITTESSLAGMEKAVNLDRDYRYSFNRSFVKQIGFVEVLAYCR